MVVSILNSEVNDKYKFIRKFFFIGFLVFYRLCILIYGVYWRDRKIMVLIEK